MKTFALILLLMTSFLLPVTTAQEAQPIPLTVTITASDGLAIYADYYTPAEGDTYPAVLLLHMLNSNHAAWSRLIPVLLESGYAVLAVDLRGHGQTGGDRDWALAELDVQTMIDWLRQQPGVSGIAIIGGSVGANLALRGMANDEEVVTAIALSPGLDYIGVTTEDAVEAIDRRPIMLVAAHNDNPSGESTVTLGGQAQGDVLIQMYRGSTHGTSLLAGKPELIDLLIMWLDLQFAE